MKKLDLYKRRQSSVKNEYLHNQPFDYEYQGDCVEWLNMLTERVELTPKNAEVISQKLGWRRKNLTGHTEDGGFQLAMNQGFGGGSVYLLIPSSKCGENEKKIRVFADECQPDGAVKATCRSFVKVFEETFPFKQK